MALRNDSYALHLLLPTKVDPLVSLMKVEKVPDSTYDMIGGLDQQIKEIKEARPHPRVPQQPPLPCASQRSRGSQRWGCCGSVSAVPRSSIPSGWVLTGDTA